MAEIVLFHSILGVRQGVTDAAARLRAAGHSVHVPNLYEAGAVFNDYEAADAYVQSIGGFPELLRRSRAAVEALPNDVVYAGFSSGGGAAEYLAAIRPGARGALLFSEALPLDMLLQTAGDSVRAWPADVPVQVHYTVGDPFREQAYLTGFSSTVRSSGASFELFEYAGNGHLFTDKSLPAEYDPAATAALWQHVDTFLAKLAG